MRNYFYFALLVISLAFFSCKPEEYQITPSISIGAGLLPDSTMLNIRTIDGVNILDTIDIDDVIRFVFKLEAYGGMLTEFSIDKGTSNAMIEPLNSDVLYTLLKSDSEPDDNKFFFIEDIGALMLPFDYRPRRISDTDSIVLTLSSDITMTENTVKYILNIPVKSK